MNSMAPVVIVIGILVVLVICWLWIALKPESWMPPGSNPPSPYGHGEKPKPPANPPSGPAMRDEIQRRAQKSVDDAKNLAPQAGRVSGE